MVVVTGCRPGKSEITVSLIDPTDSMSGLPSKLPTNSGPGWLPTEKIVGFWSLKKPPPTPGITQTWFEPLTLTARLGGPPVGDGTIAVATGPIPCCVAVFNFSRGPGTNVKPPPGVGTLSRMATSLEPLSATTRSGRPLRSATVTPTGLVPVKNPSPPLRAGPNWPLPRPGYTSTLLPPLLGTIRSGIPSPFKSANTGAPGTSKPEVRSASTVD